MPVLEKPKGVTTLDDDVHSQFELSELETEFENAEVLGRLVVYHTTSGNQFQLYPKLSGSPAVCCEFPEELRESVYDTLKWKGAVRVTGTAWYHPEAFFPSRMVVTLPPECLVLDHAVLDAFMVILKSYLTG